MLNRETKSIIIGCSTVVRKFHSVLGRVPAWFVSAVIVCGDGWNGIFTVFPLCEFPSVGLFVRHATIITD